MGKRVSVTENYSLCNICFEKVPARILALGSNIYLEKICPRHGRFRVVVWRGTPDLWSLWESFNDWEPEEFNERYFRSVIKDGCPFDCGLCPGHLRKPCFIVLEVTNICNLNCPVCYADSNMKNYNYNPSLEVIERMYKHILSYEVGSSSQVVNERLPIIKISGGEPTIRDDLPEIISLGKKLGFNIVLDTNGVKIARDYSYLETLKNHGLDLVYLQFDGVSDDVYLKLRGKPLLKNKIRALENCLKLGINVILVPTIVKSVNLNELGEIIRFASKNSKIVKGVMFQPISYFGRYPKSLKKGRVTIPEMLYNIESQTKGIIKVDNFIPIRGGIGCEAHCGFSCLVKVKEDKLIPVTRLPKDLNRFLKMRYEYGKITGKPKHAREFLFKYWFSSSIEEKHGDNYLWIAGMHFQDIWNIETRRLKKCCIHVITPNGYLIPFCIFNITNEKGETLYRDKYLNIL